LGGGLNSILRDLRLLPRYYRDVRAIARRMFVTNAFDSLLASLGVSVGGFSSKANPELLALSIIGGGLAMGLFSSVIGVYISERAERLRELRELERSMAKKLDGTIYARLARLIPLYVALWSGLGATTFPLAVASPYLVSGLDLIPIGEAFYLSIGSGLGLAALLGYYLGGVSGENKLVSTLRLLALASGGVVVVYIVRRILGAPI
jgi:predicted membrane protein (TIGR00267 family)